MWGSDFVFVNLLIIYQGDQATRAVLASYFGPAQNLFKSVYLYCLIAVNSILAFLRCFLFNIICCLQVVIWSFADAWHYVF